MIAKFEHDYDAETVALAANYRSAAVLGQVADEVAKLLDEGTPLDVVSAAPGSLVFDVADDEDDEAAQTAQWVAGLLRDGLPAAALAPGESADILPDQIAILARSGAALRRTATALSAAGIEHVVGSDPRNWMSTALGQAVVDLIAYRSGPSHPSSQAHLRESADCAVSDLAASPLNGFGAVAVVSEEADPGLLFASLDEHTGSEGGWSDDFALLRSTWQSFVERTGAAERTYPNLQLHVVRVQRGEPAAPGVRLLTVHKSQGREFRAVSVIGMNDGQFPDFRQKTTEQKRAELHCFYVAATRPTRLLRFSRAAQRLGRNGPWEPRASEFLGIAKRAVR